MEPSLSRTQPPSLAAALGMGCPRLTMTAMVLGEDRSGAFVISDVWLRGADGWRIWRRHSTPLAAGPMFGVG